MPRHVSNTTAMEKVCKVLICLTDPGVRRLKDITERTGIDKASALRVLDCLMDYGLVQRDEGSKEYEYGGELHAIASSLRPRLDIAKLTGPGLHRLAKTSGDSVHLLVRQGVESVCIAREIGDWPIRAGTIQVGSRRPLTMGAGSLALLAWLDDAEVEFVLTELAAEIDAHPRAELKTLRAEIRAARERGYTLMLDTVIEGVGAVGVPVRDPQGAVAAAISISSVTPRIAERHAFLGEAIRKEAAHLTHAMRQAR